MIFCFFRVIIIITKKEILRGFLKENRAFLLSEIREIKFARFENCKLKSGGCMKPICITDEGKDLIAAVIGGENPINFTRICTFNSVVPEKKIVQSTPISGITRQGNLCEVFGVLDNSDVREGYSIEGLGLFADSAGGEILFGFCEENSDAFYVPAGTENSRTEITLRIALTADCSDKIILSPNSDAYASAVQLTEEIARLDDEISRKTSDEILALDHRIDVLETVLQSEITAHTVVVTFGNLNGIEFNGIWNNKLSRIEF